MANQSRSGNAALAMAGGLALATLSLGACSHTVKQRDAAALVVGSGGSSELFFDALPVLLARGEAPEPGRWELARNDHLLGARAEPTQAQLASYGDAAPCLDALRRITIHPRAQDLTYFRVGAVRLAPLPSCRGW